MTVLKYSLTDWLITIEEGYEENTYDVFLEKDAFSCSLACAENEGVAHTGDGSHEIEIPWQVVEMASNLEEQAYELLPTILNPNS